MSTKPKLAFDYSKWDRLEDSDDETTHHPGLDRNLNIRVNRVDRDTREEAIDDKQAELREAGRHAEAEALEQKRPLYVDNVCKTVDERTIINTRPTKDDTRAGMEEFHGEEFLKFKAEHGAVLETFALASWEESHQLLLKYGDVLLTEYANSGLSFDAQAAAVAGDRPRLEALCRQNQIVHSIRALAEPVNRSPRDFVDAFFEKFLEKDDDKRKMATAAFEAGVVSFRENLEKRATELQAAEKDVDKAPCEEATASAAPRKPDASKQKRPLVEVMYEMSKEERLGPGGLDPVEVFESLPKAMQEGFKAQSVAALMEAAEAVGVEVFEDHLQRCIDSGLWKE
eukprot:TRINITY_DN91058_c0_g1_i1.p1 TRINITY_DN91058_c0_g1~~TRINITY_DN91058_c0_g1_i1.p1  ORF type:complete len:341 (-),score=102.54 TRINITY_DN91058_c0_g1_i1:57-1079(-)